MQACVSVLAGKLGYTDKRKALVIPSSCRHVIGAVGWRSDHRAHHLWVFANSAARHSLYPCHALNFAGEGLV